MMENNKKALVGNASSEKQIKDAVSKEKLQKLKAENALRFVFSTKEGRKFYWDLMGYCGIFTESADNSGSWTYYKEGKRSIGLKLLADLHELDPNVYSQMINEQKGEENE
jgi:hypothetical protein